MSRIIRIATRQSPLALWQANYVKQRLIECHPHLMIEMLPIVTQGDIILDTPLAKIGGKGLFVKQLEIALLNHEADIAVHSMKDVPAEFPEELGLSVICPREDHRDVFVSNQHQHIDELPLGSTVGTSSLRRQSQLRAYRPDLHIKDLRGNVGTRLAKLDANEYDGIILAAAGLKRLNLSHRITSYLTIEQSLPAVGQGAVGIETRLNDTTLLTLLAPLQDEITAYCVNAERAMNTALQGGCQVPIAGFAQYHDNIISLKGLVASIDGRTIIQAEQHAPAHEAVLLGKRVAEQLISLGANEILQTIYSE